MSSIEQKKIKPKTALKIFKLKSCIPCFMAMSKNKKFIEKSRNVGKFEEG
jgi:hypothetical protein